MYTLPLRWLRKLQITPKVFLITLVCFESLILLLGYSYHKYSSGILVDSQMNYAVQMVQKADSYLEMNLQHIRTNLLTIAHDTRFAEERYDQIDQWLNNNLIYYIPNVSNIHVLSGREVLASTSLNSWDLPKNTYLMDELGGMDEFNRIYWIGPYFSNTSGHTLTSAMSIRSDSGKRITILFDVDLANLYRALLPNDNPSVNGQLLLLDSQRNPIYGTEPYMSYDYRAHLFSLSGIEPALFRRDWTQTEAKDSAGKQIIVTRGLNEITGWQMAWIMNKSDLLQPLDYSVRLSWWLALASLLLSAALSFLISSFISRPIRKIAASINEVSAGNLNSEVRLNRQDEIGFLAMHFNKMTKRIGELIHELKETERQKKRSDFKALHMQIKPHFLYNTLNTISMMGRQGQADQMDHLIQALTSQLHYTLDASPEPVTLWEELKAIENYVQLMQIRYPGKFTLETDIDPPALDKQLPKFILQPLIENAIFHGLVPSKDDGLLFIGAVVEEEHWEVLIEDTGIGMNEQALSELADRMHNGAIARQAGEHIGMLNVHERLSLMFGSEYSIDINSEEKRGTRIVIRMPLAPLELITTP